MRRTEAGHFLQEEVPDVLAEAIRDVASRIEEEQGEEPEVAVPVGG